MEILFPIVHEEKIKLSDFDFLVGQDYMQSALDLKDKDIILRKYSVDGIVQKINYDLKFNRINVDVCDGAIVKLHHIG